ncbi:MAG: sulfurase, partial [Pseudomonadota bacterium]
MTLLTPTEITGTVTWLGLVPSGVEHIRSAAVTEMSLDWGGPVGDVHHGVTRPACVRVKRQYAADTEIRNARQLSILSEEEMAEIAAALGMEKLEPEWLGATVVMQGIPDLTLLPPAS